MNSFHAGHWMKRSGYRSFEPGKINRPWKIDDAIVQESLSTADRHLGRLDMFSEYVPNFRLSQHEAGHFLVAYLMGVLPKAYTLSAWDAFSRYGRHAATRIILFI